MNLLVALILLSGVCGDDSWKVVSVHTKASFRGLSAVSEKIVWASGTEGTVIRTEDGGDTWVVLRVAGGEKLDFRGIHALDRTTAVIMSSGPAEGGAARIYRTTDAGANWTLAFQTRASGVFMDAVAFWDSEHGLVLSDPVGGRFVLFSTDDGGKSWKVLAPKQLPPALQDEGGFAASNSCLTVWGTRDVWFGTGGAKVARVFHSDDRGETWTVSETPMRPPNASSGIFSMAFRDARNGIAVGGDYAHPNNSPIPNVMVTTDGGMTWKIGGPTEPAGIYLSSVAFAPGMDGDAAAAGTAGAVSIGRDGKVRRTSCANLNSVAIPSKSAAYAVGPTGMVARHQY